MSVYGEEHDVPSHMFRLVITDMQDKYCGDCYDVYLIQSQYTKVAAFGPHHKRGGATPQNLHKSPSRLYFGIFSTPVDIKNMPHPTAPSEFPENPVII